MICHSRSRMQPSEPLCQPAGVAWPLSDCDILFCVTLLDGAPKKEHIKRSVTLPAAFVVRLHRAIVLAHVCALKKV
jgi:hypothetical protein